MDPSRSWTATAAGLLGLAVILGAFGAHSLKEHLSPYALGVYEKGVFYHFVHALGLLALQGLSLPINERDRRMISRLLFLGILLFSGSLYLLAVFDIRAVGIVTPIGGLLFIGGWLTLAFKCARG